MIAGGKVVVTRILPLHHRPIYQGYIGGVESVAIAVGPLIGGAVTIASSWRAVFYISIPIGVINGLGLLLFGNMPNIPNPEITTWRERLRALDLPSVALLIPCVVCLVLALTWAGAQYAWGDFRVILTLTLSAVLALLFALLQWYKKDSATLPPRIVTQRSIACSSMFSFCNSACLFVLIYYVSHFHISKVRLA
jgi:MFS family permease